MFEKIDVNGENESLLYSYFKKNRKVECLEVKLSGILLSF